MLIYRPSASFVRPADTTDYAAADLIANSATAGSVTPLSFPLQGTNIVGPFTVKRAKVHKSSTGVANWNVRLHLFSASPTVANGDNGALSAAAVANYLGFISCDGTTIPGDRFSDGAVAIGAQTAGAELNIRLPSGTTIYGLLEALAAYTPTSEETITVTLDLIEHYPRG